jgi:hypothetical protein
MGSPGPITEFGHLVNMIGTSGTTSLPVASTPLAWNSCA